MIAENIKTLLGEELAQQVESALKGKGKDGKDIEVVAGNDGSYVPIEKYEQVRSQSQSAEKALKTAADALRALGGSGDAARFTEDVKAAQSAIAGLEENHQKEIAKLQKSTAVRMALGGKVHDPADILAFIDLDQVEVDEAGSITTDLDSLLKPVKEAKPYLFKEAETKPPEIKGAKPAEPNGRNEPAANVSGPVII